MKNSICSAMALLVSAFVVATLGPLPAIAAPDREVVDRAVDAWHGAAARADGDSYFGAMTDDAVFLGTDATERWTKAEFEAAYRSYFDRGKAWTFVPIERHVVFAPSETWAWFDERLDTQNMGECRGSGVVQLHDGEWKIAQYNLTVPIPNALVKDFVTTIAATPSTETIDAAIRSHIAPLLEDAAANQLAYPTVTAIVRVGGDSKIVHVRSETHFGRSTVGDHRGHESALWPVASLTKPLTGALLADAIVRGEASLSGPGWSCRELGDLCPDGRPATLRELATHWSGLARSPKHLSNHWGASLAVLQRSLARTPLQASPGAEFRYSTLGYAQLGKVLGEAAGTDYAKAMTERILLPWGLNNASFAGDNASVVPGVSADDKPEGKVRTGPDAFSPSGGLYLSAKDIAAWMETLLAPPTAHARAVVALQLRPIEEAASFPGSVSALGWQYMGAAGLHWHSGFASGHRTTVALHAERGVAVALLANRGAAHTDMRMEQAAMALAAALSAPTQK